MGLFRLPLGRITADYYQSPHPTPDLDPAPALIAAFTGAKKSLHFGIYSLTHPGITQAVLDAHARGVKLLGVVDATEAKTPTSKVPALVAAGIDVRGWGKPFTLMHSKAFVADGVVAGLGSFNWTTGAEDRNVETLLIARGTQVGRVMGPALVAQIVTAHDAGTALQ